MKYGVVKIGGSQYLVSKGDEIIVNKLSSKEGEKLELDDVLLLVDGQKVSIGQPLITNSKIRAKVLRHFKGAKIRVAKFKAKTGYRRVKGFRSQLTSLKIEEIH